MSRQVLSWGDPPQAEADGGGGAGGGAAEPARLVVVEARVCRGGQGPARPPMWALLPYAAASCCVSMIAATAAAALAPLPGLTVIGSWWIYSGMLWVAAGLRFRPGYERLYRHMRGASCACCGRPFEGGRDE